MNGRRSRPQRAFAGAGAGDRENAADSFGNFSTLISAESRGLSAWKSAVNRGG